MVATRAVARRERTASPGGDYDAFGNRIDGREEEMRDVVWRAVLEWYRECPIKPPEIQWKAQARGGLSDLRAPGQKPP